MPNTKNTTFTANDPKALLGNVNTVIDKINDYDKALRGKNATMMVRHQMFLRGQKSFALRNYANNDTPAFTDELKTMCKEAGLAIVEENARWGLDVNGLTRDKLTSLIRAIAAKTAALTEQSTNQDMSKKAKKLATYLDVTIQRTAANDEEAKVLTQFVIEESEALRGEGQKIDFTWSGRTGQLHDKAAQLARAIDHDVNELDEGERVAFVGRIFTASGAMQMYAGMTRNDRSELGNNFVTKYKAEALFSGQSTGRALT